MNALTSHNRPLIESELSDASFKKISDLALKHAGIVLAESKRSMVKSRLTRRLREHKLKSFDEYLAALENDAYEGEQTHFISALTTNVSHFFREDHHFRFLKEQAIPKMKEKLSRGERVRIWSAGCSNGQEPYSIAMTILDELPDALNQDLRILATDIDPQVLVRAKTGVYPDTMSSGLDSPTAAKFVKTYDDQGELTHAIDNKVKQLVSFRQLNLHDNWPMTGLFDVIFCRNVVIYFDDPTREKLFEKFSAANAPGGWLMLGHSERLSGNATSKYENAGVTTYRRTGLQTKNNKTSTPSKYEEKK